MSQSPLATATECVRKFAALLGTDICWPDEVIQQLSVDRLDTQDVLYVLKNGDAVECEKETVHGAVMLSTGETCDQVSISVEFWTEVSSGQLAIRRVNRI